MADDRTDAPGDGVPPWLTDLVRGTRDVLPPELARYAAPVPADARGSSVLVLFGTGVQGPDLLLLRRSGALRDHPGQVCFPGGSHAPGDGGPVRTALRETWEETGLDPSVVRIVGAMDPLNLAHSGFSVVPVLGWWGAGGSITGDGQEIVSIHRVPLADLADPGARLFVRLPDGHLSPGFLPGNLFVWGFTAALTASLLRLGGWELPWDTGRVEDLSDARRRYGGGPPP
ncbi:CoA pyrophosphatase [Streptomyces sp. NPDC051784]|uniref:NUDIX hydrolase n=1 Tax=Streptomyces sp. NPDC051784 TaxID=3155805 RepID=UPI0034348073